MFIQMICFCVCTGADDVSLDPAANTRKSKSSIGKKVVLHSTKKKTQRVVAIL